MALAGMPIEHNVMIVNKFCLHFILRRHPKGSKVDRPPRTRTRLCAYRPHQQRNHQPAQTSLHAHQSPDSLTLLQESLVAMLSIYSGKATNHHLATHKSNLLHPHPSPDIETHPTNV